MKEKLVEQLKKLVENGVKKSELEEGAGLPSNSLSSVLSGKKEMPDSWVEKIENYFSTNKNSPAKIESKKNVSCG